MTVHRAGQKPIVKSNKLHHLRRTVVERQELGPRPPADSHVRWKASAGGVMVAAAIAGSAAAQAAPPTGRGMGGDGLDFGPTPAAEVAVAPAPDRETLIHLGPPLEAAGRMGAPGLKDNPYVSEGLKDNPYVADLKDNPYVGMPAKRAKARIVKKTRPAAEPAYMHVDDLKDNPY